LLLCRRSLFSDIESPEELYQHFGKLRGSGASMPAMPQDLDTAVLEVLQACLQLDPAARPTAKQLLTMPFFSKQY
jgi:serine/threonine protein kinase